MANADQPRSPVSPSHKFGAGVDNTMHGGIFSGPEPA